MEPQPAPSRARRRRAAAGAVVAVLVTGLLTGCGLRLETPPPAEPVPDALEVVRRTAVSDSLLVAHQAQAVAETVRRERLRAELERVADDALAQADELGGEYDSGLEESAGSTSADASPSHEARTPQDVVLTLVDAAARSRAAAGTTADGPLARLLASIGASQTVSATRLARMTRSAGPAALEPQIPVPDRQDGAGSQGADDEPSPAASGPSAPTSPSPASGEVTVAPEGLTGANLSALIASEDAAGYALQVRAARADSEQRERLLARSTVHRDRSQAWAELAGTAGTDQDPRRVAYQVPAPEEVGHRELARGLEADLAVDYASVVGTSVADTRTVLVDLLVDAALAGESWGARPVPFPGLPEQSSQEG